jgi:hypothetical protein
MMARYQPLLQICIKQAGSSLMTLASKLTGLQSCVSHEIKPRLLWYKVKKYKNDELKPSQSPWVETPLLLRQKHLKLSH